ncbi:adhesin [Spiroplasma endosymbiont of Poecilobothrus nobilitatus]|uniref:adhesin n=1 Tax=Spiroplasma endosymbiont of Poecilobothrus nobilitatus TaxID=1209220 RepID=UPI00313C6132
MKKLLNILTISTLTAIVPAPFLANTVQTSFNRDFITSNSNNDYLPIKRIKGINELINSVILDSNNNTYFGTDTGAFVLKQGATTPTKIDGINAPKWLYIDSKDNIYFGADGGVYKLASGSTTPTKIDGINGYVYSFTVDSKNNNIYFGADDGVYKLASGSTTPNKIDGINEEVYLISIDEENNIYFNILFKGGVYKLASGSTTPTKIDGINTGIKIVTINCDNKNNAYIATNNGVYNLLAGKTLATKIENSGSNVSSLIVDKYNNVYFLKYPNNLFKLASASTTPTKIDGINAPKWFSIDSKDNIYFGTDDDIYILQTALSWVKTQSQFNLVDSTKNLTWTRPDLLSVGGELNIDIANPNIDKVVFDNVQQGQTNKHWTINVKPETAPRDHNLQVMFTLGGKQYTSEIMASMQAHIEPPTPPVQQNLSDLIKTTDLDNIIDNNDKTIFLAVNQKNGNVIDDFSQIEIIDKTNTQATLSVIEGSKSYQGSVEAKYNVVPATVVDLKIKLKPTAPDAIVVKDYLGQIDTSNITNPVNTFYYTNSESIITMVKPTTSSVITGIVYGCDDNWNKTSEASNIDPSSLIPLDGSQLNTKDGKYVVELSDNLGHTNNVYLQINKEKKDIKEYWNTPNGKQFEQWAEDNGYDNIRGSSASKLNNLFALSPTWKQSLKHLYLKLDNFVVDNIQNVTQDEIDNYKTKLVVSVKAQVEKYAPDVVENTDYAINTNNLVAGDWTTSKDIKVQHVESSTKLLGHTAKTIPVQQKEQPTPDNNKKSGLSGWTIFGIVVGSLFGLFILAWLFKKFVITPFVCEPIRKKKAKAFAIKTEKDIAQMKKDDEEWESKQKGGK